MITWMQRHRKYLVITIWISVIAFVGAGFVGWGAYDFNADRSTSVAKVGDTTITVNEFQMAYGNHYAYYNAMFNGELTRERAEQMGLDKIVLDTLVDEALLLNYAKELGLKALDSDVTAQLAKDENFQTDRNFDKALYYRVLQNAQIKPSAYEQNLKKQVLLQKLNNIVALKPVKSEVELFTAALFMQDKLRVEVLRANPSDVIINDENLKAFWEPQKSEFLTPKTYTLDTIVISPSAQEASEEALKDFFEENKFNYRHEDGKLQDFEEAKEALKADVAMEEARKEALSVYLAFKKGEVQAQETHTITESDPSPLVDLAILETTDTGEILKPIETDEGYVVAKLTSVTPPAPMSFEEAKPFLEDVFEEEQTQAILTERAQAALETFSGEVTGFLSRDSAPKIADLSEEETSVFLSQVFDNNAKKDFILLDEKAVLYEILEQNLLDQDKIEQYNTLVRENIEQIKNNEVNQALVDTLKKRYEIEYYYKGN
jgi:peptidyl-prolyl cis-trans isomerase D